MAKEAAKLPSKMTLQDVTATLPSNLVESTASLSMRCNKCDGLDERDRLCFFHGLKRQRLYTLIKGICEFHPKSQFSISLWDYINRLDSGDTEQIAKLMSLVGNCHVNSSVFNLFNGCQTQWSFFETCNLPDPIPEFASPELLSRALSEHRTVSWEKVLCKLHQALQDDTLSPLSLLRAMLACRILITLEKNESSKGSLRLNSKGKKLLTAVLPCSYSSNRVWPASSILFYVIFEWVRRASMVDEAMSSLTHQNKDCAKIAGYRVLEARLKRYDTIEVDLKPSSCSHKLTVQSTFDQSAAVFPVTPKGCTSCPASKKQALTSFTMEGGKKFYQIMQLFQMFMGYVKHLSHGETPREMIVGTVLYILKAGTPSSPKPVPSAYLDKTYQRIADHVGKQKSIPIKPPLAALDFKTHEGRHVKRKKPMKDIQMPKEVQTIKSYVETLKICERQHGSNKPPQFHEECDAVAEMLTQEKETTLDIDLKKIPNAMRPVVRSSPERQDASKFVSGKRKRRLFESDEEEEEEDDEEHSNKSPTKSERKRCQLEGEQQRVVCQTKKCTTAADVRRSQPPPQPDSVKDGSAMPKSVSKTFVPLSSAVSARVEKVVLEDSKEESMTQSRSVLPCAPMETDVGDRFENDCCRESNGASGGESGNECDDESDSESESESDSESDGESGDDNRNGGQDESDNDSEEGNKREQNKADEKKRGLSAAQPSPLNTPVRDVAETDNGLQTASPRQLTVDIEKMPLPLQDSRPTATRNLPEAEQSVELMEPHQKMTHDTSSSVQAGSDEAKNGPDKVLACSTQMPLTECTIEEVSPCKPLPQLQTQPHTQVLGESDVEELFNGEDQKEDTTGNWVDLIDEIPPKTLMDPVSSEIVSRGEPVKGEGNITVGPVSLDTAQRAMCVTKIMREVGGLNEMVPPIELAYTFNGEVAFRVGTNQKQLYSLDTFPGGWTTLQSFPDLLRVIVMSAALQSLDATDLTRIWITSEKRVVCLPSTTGRIEMKIHPMDLLLAVPDIGRRFREAVRADVAGFAAWIRSMSAEERGKIETIVREANLTTRDQSKTIDLDYFCRFFNNFVNALPWIEGN